MKKYVILYYNNLRIRRSFILCKERLKSERICLYVPHCAVIFQSVLRSEYFPSLFFDQILRYTLTFRLLFETFLDFHGTQRILVPCTGPYPDPAGYRLWFADRFNINISAVCRSPKRYVPFRFLESVFVIYDLTSRRNPPFTTKGNLFCLLLLIIIINLLLA